MGFNQILKIFLPKDKVFYELFNQVADNLVNMSEILIGMMQVEDLEKQKEIMITLGHKEHENDNLTHRLFVELGENFITPFDREDIHALAMALDDVADFIYAASKKIVHYHVGIPDQTMKDMVAVVKNATISLRRAVNELRGMKHLEKINEACVAINSFENQADLLLDEAVGALFSHPIDPVELIKLKEIYEDLEIVTDKCEDASDVIESIIIKYS